MSLANSGGPGAIHVHGAREHNLKNLSFSIPLGKFVVITGVSGSGKSTLAFDLLFAEGQRRFLDAMNAYARQFVEQLPRPEVDRIVGLPPTVSIEQRNSKGGGKSTVATVTEVHHFIRLLYARLGTPYCPACGVAVQPQTRDQVIDQVRRERTRRGELTLLAPVVRMRKGFHSEVAVWAAREGFERLRADGTYVAAEAPLKLDRFKEHNIEVVVGVVRSQGRSQVAAWVERGLELGKGVLMALDPKGNISLHSTLQACPSCGISVPELDPKHFSYNSSQGWCPTCRGFGELFYLPDAERGSRADAIEESWYGWQEGKRTPCGDCRGVRLNPVSRSVRLSSSMFRLGPGSESVLPSIGELSDLNVAGAQRFFGKLRPVGQGLVVARDILPEIRERLRFLEEVGLGYLQLGRGVPTLSGGEAQRIRLAAQLGSNLRGVLYILDEPTIGLHARDNDILLGALKKLRERGNSLVVVEHDEETMMQADHIIDLGPGAGRHGGEIVASGSLPELMANPASATGRYLSEPVRFPSRGERRAVERGSGEWLVLEDASLHNLKSVTLRIPAGRLVVVTGVSGSGKSSLVRGCLLPAAREVIGKGKPKRGGVDLDRALGRISGGAGGFRGVLEVDQSPIGRTPRSVPATYVGVFDDIRKLFAGTAEARVRGFGPGRFSFNSAQGRCPTCEGAGTTRLEMNFLPPAFVVCEECRGRRFNPATLEVEYRGRSVADILDMSVSEALEFFDAVGSIRKPLQALVDTGLGYLQLGQISPTLSGGEAQRLKLVAHIAPGSAPKSEAGVADAMERLGRGRAGVGGGILFILEEPTIGLHGMDVRNLVGVLHRLCDAGHTVVVIEHHLEVIAEADWVVDMGPEAGAGGGEIVVEGTPETVAGCAGSRTGVYLRKLVGVPRKGRKRGGGVGG